jgi:hypothetical protein
VPPSNSVEAWKHIGRTQRATIWVEGVTVRENPMIRTPVGAALTDQEISVRCGQLEGTRPWNGCSDHQIKQMVLLSV